MDILKEQLNKSKELMGIVSEQTRPVLNWVPDDLHGATRLAQVDIEGQSKETRKKLEKCFSDIVSTGENQDWKEGGHKAENENLYLDQVQPACWDNVIMPMVTSGEELDLSGSNENRRQYTKHCRGVDRIRVIRLLTYLPEIQECLK